ncbi:MAG TPA: MAPEG family protein, partial [Methyloversatilis sp.]
LCRAHANCCENLPVFGALVLTAVITGHAAITDPGALWVLAARVGQSTSHLVSGRGRAIAVRFGCLVLQIGIQAVWIVRLLLVMP